MTWLEKIISMMVPSVLIESPIWMKRWHQQQQEAFIRLSRFTLFACGAGWFAHHWLFDIPMGLEPIEFWFNVRAGPAVLCGICGLFYYTSLATSRFYQVPAFVAVFTLCHTQAWVTVWYGKEAWFFFFLFVLVSNMMLRLGPLMSVIWGSFLIAVSTPVLVASGVGFENLASGVVASLTVSAIVRAGTLTEVRLFLVNQENDETQREMLDLTHEYSERVKSFIPKVIAERLTDLMERQRLSVVEASIEALKARKKNISCIFTDIRGFTQGSKNIDSFVAESVLPEVTACSDTIESLEGIPRKVGDLIFAYFDDDEMSVNVIRSLLAAVEVSRINETVNATLSTEQIKRYILVSSGEALVGNFGGLDSSIEITALGPPVNFLSRLDDLTKEPAIANELNPGDIVVSESTYSLAKQLGIDSGFVLMDLSSLGVAIRDFPEVKRIYRLTPSDALYDKLLDRIKALSTV